MDDLIITKELALGHISKRLPKTIDNNTHEWQIFLYSPTGEDLSKWIDHVRFHLHSSFDTPEVDCYKEPYIVEKRGWGEFNAPIEIFLRGGNNITLSHFLSFPNNQNPVILERRREVITFRNPPPLLYEGLTAASNTWNRFKKIKKQPHASDADIIEVPSCDPTLEKKWTDKCTETSKRMRSEINFLSQQHKELLAKIHTLIDEISQTSPNVAEAASLFI